MSVDILATILASSATVEVAQSVWKLLRQRLKEKGVQDVPEDVATVQQLQEAESALSLQTGRFTPDEAHQLTIEGLATAQNTANGIRTERMRQARITFNAAFGLAVLGVLIIFAGVILLIIRQQVAAGAVTAGVGAVTEVVTALLFKLNHETNDRLDTVSDNLSAIEAARIAVVLSEKIEDPEKRDDAIREAAKDIRTRGQKRKINTHMHLTRSARR